MAILLISKGILMLMIWFGDVDKKSDWIITTLVLPDSQSKMYYNIKNTILFSDFELIGEL